MSSGPLAFIPLAMGQSRALDEAGKEWLVLFSGTHSMLRNQSKNRTLLVIIFQFLLSDFLNES